MLDIYIYKKKKHCIVVNIYSCMQQEKKKKISNLYCSSRFFTCVKVKLSLYTYAVCCGTLKIHSSSSLLAALAQYISF